MDGLPARGDGSCSKEMKNIAEVHNNQNDLFYKCTGWKNEVTI